MKKCDIEPWRRCCVWAGSHGSSSLLFVKSHEEAAVFTLLNFCFGLLSSMTGCLISRCGDWGSCLYLRHSCNRLWITCWHINCPTSCQKPGIFFYGSFWAGSSVCIACKLHTGILPPTVMTSCCEFKALWGVCYMLQKAWELCPSGDGVNIDVHRLLSGVNFLEEWRFWYSIFVMVIL